MDWLFLLRERKVGGEDIMYKTRVALRLGDFLV